MSNLFIGPIILLVVALAGVVWLVWRQRRLVGMENLLTGDYPSLRSIIEDKISYFYTSFAFFFKQLGHYSYFYTLLSMRCLVIWFKVLSILAEKRFSRLIDAVHGKGMADKRGAVSLFLSDISKK